MKLMTVAAIATLITLSAMVTTQSVFAKNSSKDVLVPQQHHSGNGTTLLLGGYASVCIRGQAVADTRNISVNGHNVQVVHMTGQGLSSSLAFLNNLDTVPTFVNSPISFTVEKGNARLLLITLAYIPHGGSPLDVQALYLVTPDTQFVFPGLPLTQLISEGNGKYTIPFGSSGVPQGAQLIQISFNQLGIRTDCSKHVVDFDKLQINRRFVGIATDPLAECGIACGDAAASAEE